MFFTIESKELSVKINLIGLEINSIRSKETGQEYLWQGDPQFWKGQAPVLFPIIGALKEGKTNYKGEDYALPKHGFVRNSSLGKLVKQESDLLLFRIESNAETLRMYPFEFIFEIKFQVKGKSLQVRHQVFNTGKGEMYYSLGGHPAFNCPIYPEEKLEDYSIVFPEIENDQTWLITSDGLIGGPGETMLNNSNKISLHKHIFDQDALILKNLKSRAAILSHKTKGALLELTFDDFDYLGIWAKPGAPFVCLEPWLGIADSSEHSGKLKEKEGIRRLESGSSESKSYSINILR